MRPQHSQIARKLVFQFDGMRSYTIQWTMRVEFLFSLVVYACAYMQTPPPFFHPLSSTF